MDLTTHGMSAAELTQLGKTAALTAETSGKSLTDSVVHTIGMTKLNQEQVRRVVEAANHEAFHRKYASMDASMRVVEIEGGPADPAEVIDRLKSAALPSRRKVASSDYALPPTQKLAAVEYSEPTTKQAALADIELLKERLQATHEELTGKMASSSYYLTETVRKLAGLVRTAVDDGAYAEDFERAWGELSPKRAADLVADMQIGRAPAGVKTAHRRISEGHPLLRTFSEFAKHAEDYEQACGALRSVEEELVRVSSFLRSHR